MSMFRNILMDTIRRLEWKSVFDPIHNYIFRYRKAGGDDNASLHAENSRAVVDTVYGNTVKWNQLVNNGDFSGGTSGWTSFNANISISDGVATISKSVSGGTGAVLFENSLIPDTAHKYYIAVTAKVEDNSYYAYMLFQKNGISGTNVAISTQSTSWEKISGIVTPSNNTDRLGLCVGLAASPANATGYFKDVICIDLTLLGIDNLTTVADVEAWLALNVGEQDYYPYDAGSLISFGGTAIKSVGFNLFDKGDVINGRYINDDGGISSLVVRCLSNYIRVLPNTAYYFGNAVGSSSGMNHAWYDVDKHIIGSPFRVYQANDSAITSPQNAHYLRCSMSLGYLDTFIVNLSDAAKNGTYAPYWENSVDLSFAQNIPDPSNPSQPLFPNGLCSAGSVHDEVSATTATKRVGSVDLGTLDWTIANSSGNYFGYALISDAKKVVTSTTYLYTNSLNGSYSLTTRKTIYSGVEGYAMDGEVNVVIYLFKASLNTSTTTKEVFKSAMSGVILYYELATPVVVDLTPEQQILYKVDKYSTEELIIPTSVSGAPTSTPLNADIDYQYRG